MRTNRDLYLFVAGLREQQPQARPLVDYLRALADLAAPHAGVARLTLDQFGELLAGAFSAPPAATPREPDPANSDYCEWHRLLWSQIKDLDEMAAAGALENEYRYFGIDAPSGARWYNFEPLSYLECAVMGTYGGWQPGDPTDRSYVPGKVAVIDEAGKHSSVDPRELDDPVEEIDGVTWDNFCEFLRDGSSYE